MMTETELRYSKKSDEGRACVNTVEIAYFCLFGIVLLLGFISFIRLRLVYCTSITYTVSVAMTDAKFSKIVTLIHKSFHKSEFRKVFERKFAWFGIDPFDENSSIYKHECLCNFVSDQLSGTIRKQSTAYESQTQTDCKSCTCGWSTKPTKNEYLAFQSFRNVVTFNKDYYVGHHEKEFRLKLQVSIKDKEIEALKQKINQKRDPSTTSEYVSSENNC